MFPPDVFNAKVVHHQGELYQPQDMSPQAWSVRHLLVSMWSEPLLEEFVGKYSCLREAVDCLPYFDVYKSVLLVGIQVVLINRVLWEKVRWVFAYTHIDQEVCPNKSS